MNHLGFRKKAPEAWFLRLIFTVLQYKKLDQFKHCIKRLNNGTIAGVSDILLNRLVRCKTIILRAARSSAKTVQAHTMSPLTPLPNIMAPFPIVLLTSFFMPFGFFGKCRQEHARPYDITS